MKAILVRALEEQRRLSISLIAATCGEEGGMGEADQTEEKAPSPSLDSSRQLLPSPRDSSSGDGAKTSPGFNMISSRASRCSRSRWWLVRHEDAEKTSGMVGRVETGDDGIWPLTTRLALGTGDEVDRWAALASFGIDGLTGVGVVRVMAVGPSLGVRPCPLISSNRGIGKLAARSCPFALPLRCLRPRSPVFGNAFGGNGRALTGLVKKKSVLLLVLNAGENPPSVIAFAVELCLFCIDTEPSGYSPGGMMFGEGSGEGPCRSHGRSWYNEVGEPVNDGDGDSVDAWRERGAIAVEAAARFAAFEAYGVGRWSLAGERKVKLSSAGGEGGLIFSAELPNGLGSVCGCRRPVLSD